MSIASIRIALLCSALVAVASGVRAQGLADGMYGRPVAAVRFEIEGRPDTSPTLLALVDVAVGQALSQEDVRSSMERLYVAGRFESVAVVGVPGPGGVEVTFRLVPRHVVNRLTVTGTTGIGAGTLHSRLLQHYGGVPANQRTADVEQTVIQMLNDEGYLGPVVNSSIVPTHDPEGATLVLDVVAGEQTRIASVDVEGTTLVSAEQVIRRVGASVGQPFKRREIESAISAFEDDLRTRGYYEADVSLEADPAADAVHARVVVTTGPIVELRVEPADALPGDLETLIPIRRQRSADVDLLEDSKDTIVRLLKRDGYAAASVNFTRMMSDDETRLLVTFSISRGPRHFVDRIDVTEGLVVPAVTLRALLDIQPGEVFDESRFLQGLGRVVEEYLRRGYYQVEALPDRETVANRGGSDEAFVVLHPNISEGPRGDIRAVDFQFIDSHAMSESDLRAVTQSSAGEPYVEAVAAADRAALRSFYLEHGFLNVAVDVQPEFADAGRSVSLAVRINEGPQIRIAEITVVGNEHVSENLIREELGLSVGAPLSGTALLDSQQHLYDMGVFRRVSVAPADRIGSEVDARIIVSVVEAPATTIGVGGGLEGRRVTYQVAGVATEQLEFAPRGFFEIGRQNIGGRNRSLGFFSRLSLRTSNSDAEDADFTEYRTALTYRERRLFRTNTEVLVSGVSEQSRRSSFNFTRQSVNAELFHRATGRVAITGRYLLDFTRLFDVQDGIPPEDRPIIDRLFPQVRLSSVGAGVAWDRRDNPLAPVGGTFVTADVQVAARGLGSEVGFVKTFAQASYFRPLNDATVVAVRAEVGLARGFERNAIVRDDNGDPVLGPDGTPLVETVRDLPISERFFAGGNTTVRGFQLDRLGSEDVFVQNVPIGGNGLLVFNAELRRLVAQLFGRDFGVVAFVDSGNVFPDASDVNLARIRGAAGFGARWDSPVGPLRLDFGFKMTREVISGVRESGWEYHLSIGEAF